MEPDLSIIIVNLNTRGLLANCLASIRSADERVTREVIVVDNGSTDGSAEFVAREAPWVRLIRNETNTGYAYPNNQGMAIARGRHLLLLNSDTEVRPGALTRLVRHMEATPTAGACGPRLLNSDGSLQRSVYSEPSPRSYLARMLALDELFPRSRAFGNQHLGFDHARTAPVDTVLGAALLVRREVVERVGGLDESLPIHYNDYDLCLRIRRAGWEVHFVHEAEVLHHSRVTTRAENRNLRLEPELVRNLFAYFRKHYGEWGVRWVRAWTVAGFGGRALMFRARERLGVREPDETAHRYRMGMVRAGWTGRPERFLD